MQTSFGSFRFPAAVQCFLAAAITFADVRYAAADYFAVGDFDGDRRADPSRIVDDAWMVWCSTLEYQPNGFHDFAIGGGSFLSADFDGDGLADPAMVDASCNWYICLSSLGYQTHGPNHLPCSRGIPLAADFDGDGRADPAMVVGGHWHIWLSSANYQLQGPFDFAVPGATPAAGDLDGDGKADPAMVLAGEWHAWYSGAGYQHRGPVALGIAGVPFLGDFDGDGLADPAVIAGDGAWQVWMSGAGYQPQGPYNLPVPEQAPRVSAVVLDEVNGAYALAAVENDYAAFTNCSVDVNGAPLAYGLPVNFTNDAGLAVSLLLPVYYASLPSVNQGVPVSVTVRNAADELIYQSDPAPMPALPGITSPVNGQSLPADADIEIAWNAASGAQGYLAGYVAGEVGAEADQGLYAAFLDDNATNLMVPSPVMKTGTGDFYVYALAGDTSIFDLEFNPASFFLAGAGDAVKASVATPPAPTASVGLQLAKSYRKTEQGITFTIREYNPQQIQQPGTVYIQIKMPKHHLTVAFIKAFDMNGKEYFSWLKKRVYSSKRKRYCHNISVSPGTTIVIGEKTCDLEAANYSY